MDAEFVAHYLGSSMLTKGSTGLGSIQKPLKEKYFNFRKSAENKLGPEIGIRINPSGVVLLFPGSHPGQGNDEFYDISSIHFAEAVHFVHTKYKDKKPYFAFVPIDDSVAANAGKEKLFTQLDKKFKHLEKVSHPPMLACVMRRPTGVKAVDCHVFIVQHPDDALQMANMIHRFQAGPGHYDRRSFGPPASGPVHREMYPNPDVIPQNRDSAHEMGPPRDFRPGDREHDDYAIYRGRGLELRNDHFRTNEPPSPGDPERRGFEPNRSFDRNSANYTEFERRQSDDRYRNNYDDGRSRPINDRPIIDRPISDREIDQVERRPKEFRSNAGFVERDSFGREYQFDNAISHERQRSGESGPGRPRYGSDKSGAMSPRNEYGSRFDRHSDIIPHNRYNQYPNRPDIDPYTGPPVTGNVRDDVPPRRSYHEQSYPRPGGMQSPPHSPRGRSPPGAKTPPGTRSPRDKSPDTDVCSASNLESRQEFDANGKPIAKVPPNRHAGVRVLPSLPIPGARSQLKPVSPRADETSPNLKEGGKAPTYNFETIEDSDSDNPYDNAPDKRIKEDYRSDRSDRSVSEDIALVERLFDDATTQETDRAKDDGFKYGNSVYTNDQYNRYGGGIANPNQNAKRVSEPYSQHQQNKWSYQDEKDKYMNRDRDGWQGAYKSKSAQDFAQPSYGSEYSKDGQHGAKDAEIADMFSRLKTGRGAGHDVDFEKGLGYLPW